MNRVGKVLGSCVGNKINIVNNKWSFSNQDVVENFSSHIRHSIPFYDTGHHLIVKLSDYFIRDSKEEIAAYDLGCSNGELTYRLAYYHRNIKNIKWFGIDCEAKMIQQSKKKKLKNLDYVVSDIATYEFFRSNFFVCYYVLQFMSFEDRLKLLKSIYNCLEPGGAVVIFEKVLSSSSKIQEMISSIYVEYKLENNYMPDEIIKKEKSLRGVLNSWSSEEYQKLLSDIGFKKQETIMKYLCFEGILAIK